jgi:hypothetical protein
VVLYSPAQLPARAALAMFLITWIVSAIGGLYTVVNLFTGLTTPVVPGVVGGFVFAWYISSYITGLWLSLRSMPEDLRPSAPMRALLYAAQLVMLPVFGALESLGVFYAMVKPEKGFHVVKKSGTAMVAAQPAVAGEEDASAGERKLPAPAVTEAAPAKRVPAMASVAAPVATKASAEDIRVRQTQPVR